MSFCVKRETNDTQLATTKSAMRKKKNHHGTNTRRAGNRTRRALRMKNVRRLLACILALLGVALAVTAVVLLTGQGREPASEDEALTVAPSPTPSASPTPSESPPQSSAPEETPPPPRVRVLPETLEGYPVVAKLTIETLDLELFVLGDSSDAALEVSPGLYAGPDSPEFAGNIVITGHNYKNDSHFGRLDELENGDTVILMDKWGDEYRYEVYDSETIAPDQIDALEEYEGERALALLTCTQSGKNRLLVRCRLLEG